MSLDPAALPLLLAGPVLRRVESDLVCVWIATSQRCDVSLLLFEGTDVAASSSLNDDLRAPWVSALQQTLQYGRHFHVLTVTLDLRSPGGNASRSAGPLKSNHGYSYDLRLHPQSDPTNPLNLRALGLLAGPVPLGYDLGELPVVQDRAGGPRQARHRPWLLPAHVRDAAARRRSGAGRSVSAAGRLAHRATNAIRADSRPRAGGVSRAGLSHRPKARRLPLDRCADRSARPDAGHRDAPAPAVPDRRPDLRRRRARGAAASAQPRGPRARRRRGTARRRGRQRLRRPPRSQLFPPAFRRDISTRRAGFTTTDGDSHLFTFGEFVAYYVLTWSPELWTRDLWPADFDPAKIVMPLEWRDAFLYEDAIAQPPVKSGAYEELLEALPETGSGVPGAPPGRSEHPDVHAQWYFDQRRLWLTSKFWSPALFEWWMRRFREGLPRVRRALANVPTYMIADDHEITDDWYFSRQWRERVFTRPLGVDIIRHGLMAYTLMQGWGNDPRRWAGGVERELLEQMRTWIGGRAGGTPHQPESSARTARPAVHGAAQHGAHVPSAGAVLLPGRRPVPSRAGGRRPHAPAFPASACRRRAASTTKARTGLFGDSAMAEALPEPPADDTKITFVVTGVPVLGPDGMELALLPFQRLARLLLNVDAEAVVLRAGDLRGAALGAVALPVGRAALGRHPRRVFRGARLLERPGRPGGAHRAHRPAHLERHHAGLGRQDAGAQGQRAHARRLRSRDRRRRCRPSAWAGARRCARHSRRRWRWARWSRCPLARCRIRRIERASRCARRSCRRTAGPRAPRRNVRPNWGWRLAMERDQRPESTSTPSIERRWTPVERPIDPVAPGSLGWHAKAVRRLAYGRVFAFERNVGIVTLERSGEAWSVRHVIAGELPPLAETGTTPAGLQPYVIHRIALTPPAARDLDHEAAARARRRRVGRGSDRAGAAAAAALVAA